MLSGIVNVYKEAGYTSHDVVAKMRGIFSQRKIGHTGTLDPDAVGVLPVCLGKATKVCDLITEKDKEYECTLLLGTSTDTQDISGEVLRTNEVNSDEDSIRNAILSFVGRYDQIPPMYSALKVNGKKLYDLARQGIEVERKLRTVYINQIEILNIEVPEITMRVSCSKGTYIRTLCNDIGEALGCGGCMKDLIRTKAAGFFIDQSLTLKEIETIVKAGEVNKILLPIDTVFPNHKKLYVCGEAAKLLYNGNRLPMDFFKNLDENTLNEDEAVCVYSQENQFAGVYIWQKKNTDFKPVKLFIEKD